MASPKENGAGRRRSGNQIKWLLGFGCFVQGFRGFPWMGANFFMKDQLNLNPSALQLIQNSVNVPMVVKPLYGVVSDAVYISGQHRTPYIAIGALLQAVSWLAMAVLSKSGISILTMLMYSLLSNLGAAIAEVANDAIVAEAGKTSNDSSSCGELQSFVWIASSLGGVLGNLLGGVAVDKSSPQSIFLLFGLLTTFQFLITAATKESSLNLPNKSSSDNGIRKQLSDLSLALKRPEIAYSIAWLAASTAFVPALTGTMFFYQTQHLKIDASLLGISKVVGQVAVLLWAMVYDRWLKPLPCKKLIIAVQVTTAVVVISDMLFVKGFYRDMGVPDTLYVVVFSGLLEVVFTFKNLPFSVLMARLCPPGCEGSLMAFVTSAVALSLILSGYLGIGLASFVGVTGSDFSCLPRGLVIEAICLIVPLFFASWIHDETAKSKARRKEE